MTETFHSLCNCRNSDSAIQFFVDNKSAFEIPLQTVQQAVVQGKHEVGIELLQDDKDAAGESLCEVRIVVPDVRPPDGEMDIDNGEELETAAQLFCKEIQNKGDIGESTSKAIATFELFLAVPRGRYDVDLYETFLKLHNKTYSYKIPYKNVSKMFLFDASQQTQQHLFVIGLEPPVRQGRTAYPFLVVQFDSAIMIEQSFAVDEATCEEKYNGLLKPIMKGPQHDVVTRVFKALTKKKVLVPGGSYQSKAGGSCVRCSYKAQDGLLFMLEKSFFFAKKPPMHIRHNQITSIEFDRVGSLATGSSKTFDLKINTKDGKNNEYRM